MTNFNSKANHKTADDWQEYALTKIEENTSVNWVFAIFCLLFGGSVLSAPFGLLTCCLIIYSGWKKSDEESDKEEAIKKYGCVAAFLTGNDFKAYLDQFGSDSILEELSWADENDIDLSDDAREFLDATNPKQITPVSQRVYELVGTVTNSFSKLLPSAREENTDLIAVMSDKIKNTLIVGQQGCGKGVVVSNALEAIRIKHSDTIIFYIDPKGDDKESGYFANGRVTQLERRNCLEKSPSSNIEWFKDAIKKFQLLPYPKLLIIDEGTYISGLCKENKEGNWLKGVINSFTSMGDSRGCNLWLIVQNPQTEDIGVNPGLRSQFKACALVHVEGMSSYESMRGCKWLASKPQPSDVQKICEDSPTQRAFYHDAFREWLPLPTMTNYSGYDRDNNVFTVSLSQPILQDSLDSLDSELNDDDDLTDELSPIASDVLAYFASVKKKLPKSIRDLKKASRLDKYSNGQLVDALEELVQANELIFHDDNRWSKINWE